LLKKHKSHKLYYDKYLYKLGVLNSLSHIFREKNFSFARSILDQIQHNYEEEGKLYYKVYLSERSVSHLQFNEAKLLLSEFTKTDTNEDFKLRVERHRCLIYTNNLSWLENLIAKVTCDELWEPVTPKLEKNIIISDEPKPYEYKVTLGARVNPQLANWAKNNQDKIWIGEKLLSYIEDSAYTQGMYFYLRDERILQLVSIIIGNSIKRVDKIVCSQNIDK